MMTSTRQLLSPIVMLTYFLTTGLQASSIEIIDLKNRPAEELVPLLTPMLGSDGAITGTAYQLIIRTSPQNLQQIKQLLKQLDKAPRQLLISVFQGSERELHEVSGQIDVRYDNDNIHLGIGQQPARRGARARVQDNGVLADGSVHSTRVRSSRQPVQQLRILSGESGYIETGQSIPYFNGRLFHPAGNQAVLKTGVAYKDMATGFTVRPLLHNETVTLEINPYQESISRNAADVIDTQSASTRVSGALGKWLEIGGTDRTSRSEHTGIGSHYQSRERQSSRLWIRADLLD